MTRNFSANKRYTTQEFLEILHDLKGGMSYKEVAKTHGRSTAALKQVVSSYQWYQRGGKVHGSLGKIFKELETNGKTEPKTSLSKLEAAFTLLREAVVDVIDEETSRRGKEWVERALKAEKELEQYKSAAKSSSIVGALQRRWGLSVN